MRRILGYRAQTRSLMLSYTLSFGLILLILSSMQVAFFGKLRPFGATPDLMICAVLCISYFCGRYAGAVTGIAAGFLIEAMGTQGITLLPVVYMLGAYLVGHYAHAFKQTRYTVYLFYLLCALFVRAGVTLVYACLHYEYINLPQILLRTILPEAAGTAIAGLVLFFPIGWICRLLERKK